MNEYLHVVTTWLDGKPTSDLVLWGHTMLWWGRLGKVLLFLAGWAVVIDLINPEWLQRSARVVRRRAALARTRAQERRTLRRIIGLREAVSADLYTTHAAASSPHTAHVWHTLNQRRPNRVPSGIDLTVQDYRAFHREAVEQVAREHTCAQPHDGLCQAQVEYLRRRVEQLVTAQLPADKRHLVDESLSAEIGGLGALVGTGIAALVVLVGWARGVTWLVWSGAALFGLSWSWRVRLWLSPAFHRLRGWVASMIGVELGQSRPLHTLRFVAFVLFVIGGHFDLLAS